MGIIVEELVSSGVVMSLSSLFVCIAEHLESEFEEQIVHPDRYQGATDIGRIFLSELGLTETDTHKECIKVIELDTDQFSGFSIGSALKYLWRLGEKHPFPNWAKDLPYLRKYYHFQIIQDMKKSAWYLRRHAEKLEESTLFKKRCEYVASLLDYAVLRPRLLLNDGGQHLISLATAMPNIGGKTPVKKPEFV